MPKIPKPCRNLRKAPPSHSPLSRRYYGCWKISSRAVLRQRKLCVSIPKIVFEQKSGKFANDPHRPEIPAMCPLKPAYQLACPVTHRQFSHHFHRNGSRSGKMITPKTYQVVSPGDRSLLPPVGCGFGKTTVPIQSRSLRDHQRHKQERPDRWSRDTCLASPSPLIGSEIHVF